jgi:hypothetical protein
LEILPASLLNGISHSLITAYTFADAPASSPVEETARRKKLKLDKNVGNRTQM